jgi:hypothetical protein
MFVIKGFVWVVHLGGLVGRRGGWEGSGVRRRKQKGKRAAKLGGVE